MLGIPIGTKEFINNFVHETLAPKMKALNRLREFPTQIAYHMLRLCLAPCSVFLVRALGDSYEYFADWNQKVERAVFELADQLHDYDEFKGKEEEHWDEATIAMFEEEMQRRARRKEITCHTERNFEIARKLIGLSSREGGLGIMLTSTVCKDAFLASTVNSLTILKARNIAHTISERTQQFLSENENRLNQVLKINEDEQQQQQQQQQIEQVRGIQKKLSSITQQKLKKEVETLLKEDKWLEPLFQDHQGEHVNRVLIKPPTETKTFQISNKIMQEIISQTLLLPNDFGMRNCYAKTQHKHNCQAANHMNACANIGGNATRHTHAKHALEKIARMLEMPVRNEVVLAKKPNNRKEYRADIYLPESRALLDVTCVQTSQNHKTIKKAMLTAYERKRTFYNNMKKSGDLLKQFNTGDIFIIPIVIGPRGQFFQKSWDDLTQCLGIDNIKACRQEIRGKSQLISSKQAPEKALFAISLLKALAFRVAVDTAIAARKWQSDQIERWNLTGEQDISL